MQWPLAYGLTLLVEVPLVLFFMRTAGWVSRSTDGGLRWPQAVLTAWALNLTHPVLWWVSPLGMGELMAAEALIVAVEGLALAGVAWRVTRPSRPGVVVLMGLLIAFAANLASFSVGAVLAGLLG